uniref:Nucleoside diphosphate kinase n=1 Tax=Tetradesmus obliquus TaxID=3088 RepID=A0A383VTV5_TETOB|eukprot:jgi/Sobl393_1/1031/SZX77619.1
MRVTPFVARNSQTQFSSACSSATAGSQLQAAAAPRAAARRSVRALAVRAEISYVMVKPDGVQRGLVGDIISRFERKGFKLVGLKLYQTPKDVAEEHYKELSSKPFYGKLVEYIVSGPVVAMVWEGAGVVASARKIIGATNPLAAEPGTIRGDFAIEVGRNIVHGSDSVENGERETALWFPEGVQSWDQTMTPWLKE